MKRCELLSPAGSMEMLKYAIAYGADAVYLAGNRFGARKFAANFDDKELEEAVKYSHLRNVKVYITINTLIYDSEVNEFVEYVKFIHSLGVDAVLVQDFGMMNLIRKIAPNLEIHASTQFHNEGAKTIELLKSIGVKRAVLDREMSLSEIKKLPKSLEIEVFCHGALCVSYSGQCLLSSSLLNRSGNRGECAGLCRLPYKIKTDQKIDDKYGYHLSLKDLCSIDYVYDLLDANVDSLKIEGRMKSPEYTGYITKIYRKLIDSYYEGKKINVTPEEKKNIQILFNRGQTKGFLKEETSENIVNRFSPNHIGIHLGTYKTHKNKIELHLTEELSQQDTIRFQEDHKGMTVNFLYEKSGNLISKASPNSVVYVDNFLNLEHDGELRLVASTKLTAEIAKLPNRKVPIKAHFTAKQNCPITLEIEEGKYRVTVEGIIPDGALKRPITEQDIEKQLSKTGDTVYEIEKLTINLAENLFINLKDLNELRRRALTELDLVRTKPQEIEIKTWQPKRYKTEQKTPELVVVLETEEQYEVAKKYTDNIFSTNATLLKRHSDIYPKYVNSNQKINNSKYMISSFGHLKDKRPSDQVYTDYMLNITNSYTANAILDNDINMVQISLEATTDNIIDFKDKVDMSKLCIFLYGKIELMKMKYDPIKDRGTHLIDRNGSAYMIKKDSEYNYLLSSNPKDRIEDLTVFKELKIGFYRIDFVDEPKEICAKILEKTHKKIYEE